jgi:hypothetical protein
MASIAPDAGGPVQVLPADERVALRETPCRNCGAPSTRNYCATCGQETALALPTARQFLREAAGRYVALDGRLWRTLAALLFHPGFLTRAYLAGRRRRYIRPARLFLVLSLLMFAVLRLVVDVPRAAGDGKLVVIDAPDEVIARAERESGAGGGPRIVVPGMSIGLDDGANLTLDAAQNPFAAELKRRLDRFNALPREDKVEQVFFGVVRYGPYAMVVLLPAFALLLKVLYLGRRRRYPARPYLYAEHLVFASHDLSFLFLVVIIAALVPWKPAGALLAVWVLGYSLWAMRAVYGGRWVGVLARAWLIAVAYFVLFVFVTVGLVLAAVFVR